MRIITLVAALLLAVPAWAEDLPQGPKAAPPEPLPEPQCDVSKPSNGDWLLGRWVAPLTKWEFLRTANGLVWTLDGKAGVNADFIKQDVVQLNGQISKVTGCTVNLTGGQGRFEFDGVMTDSGKLYGYAHNPEGQTVRYILRRER